MRQLANKTQWVYSLTVLQKSQPVAEFFIIGAYHSHYSVRMT